MKFYPCISKIIIFLLTFNLSLVAKCGVYFTSPRVRAQPRGHVHNLCAHIPQGGVRTLVQKRTVYQKKKKTIKGGMYRC